MSDVSNQNMVARGRFRALVDKDTYSRTDQQTQQEMEFGINFFCLFEKIECWNTVIQALSFIV